MFEQKKTVGHYDTLLESMLVREETQWTPYKLRSLNETGKTTLADNVVTRLFNDIKSKAMSVDFAFIDDTRGNITKLQNFSSIDNAIKFLQKIDSKSPELQQVTGELVATMGILQKYSKEFELGFKLNNAVIRYMYNSLVIGLIQGTSFVVAESVEFVKDNLNLYKAQSKPSKNILKNNHIKALSNFNDLERKGQLVKFFRDTQQFKENAIASLSTKRFGKSFGGVATLLGVLGLIGFVLAFTRSIIFLYYNTRVKLSQYLKHLKDFVEMNASTLGSDAKKVKERQEKMADNLGKLADLISVDQNVSNDRANSQLDESNKIIAIDNKDEQSDNSDLGLY
jgi:uncharacterized protein YlzI (FlbEa/FlbD family)